MDDVVVLGRLDGWVGRTIRCILYTIYLFTHADRCVGGCGEI